MCFVLSYFERREAIVKQIALYNYRKSFDAIILRGLIDSYVRMVIGWGWG